MLNGEECISWLIRCKSCQFKLKEAKILPCGHFCHNCATQFTKEIELVNKEFKCDSSHDIHHEVFYQFKKTDFEYFSTLIKLNFT